jgi:pyrroline-5-carboxylate reductase
MTKIGFIGAGKMAEAMMTGLIEKAFTSADSILASDISGDRLVDLSQRCGIRITLDNAEVVRQAEICFLAVKPQQLDDVLRQIAPQVTATHLVVSIAAGKSTSLIESLLPAGRVVRVMPNIACLVGEGMNVFTRGSRTPASDTGMVTSLLECSGRALELPESQFDAVTALSGSGPAFFAYLLDRLVDGAVREGLARTDALMLAEQTLLGTARMLQANGLEPAELAAAVTSAKGTTAAGREVLETPALAAILDRTIGAAAQRSRELGRA